jgi:PAS domain S-box-containing protein
MNKKPTVKTREQLIHENDELVSLLARTQEVLKTIRNRDNTSFSDPGTSRESVFPLVSGEMSFRLFVEEMNEGVSALSPDGIVSFCNKRFAELFHSSPDQITGKPFDLFIYPEDKLRFRNFLHTGLIRRNHEILRCLPLGDTRPKQVHFSVNPFVSGVLEEKICLVACDLSGIPCAEEELRRIRQSYQKRVAEITAALNKANEELVHSRIAYLNMMQDTVEANETLRVSNIKIRKQSKKRKMAEKLLKKSEKMFRTLMNASPEAIIKMGLDGTINDISQITPEIFGFEKKKELRGRLFWDFVIPGDLEKIRRVFKETHSKELIQDLETTLVKNDKSTFTAEISLTLVGKHDGEPKAYMAIIRDVSSRKKMDVQLIHNARLVSLGEMATGIAHEINQPLNTISLTLDNFLYEINQVESIDKSYFKTKSDKIFDNIYRIRDIIEHIRDFSRYQDDHLLVAFDLHKSITNAISMISEEFKFKEIDLITDFEKTDSHVLGNVFKFEQVILNLMTNAKDALDEKKKSAPDDVRSYVKIHTFSEGEYIYVAVEDNGSGINPADLDKILLPFFSTKEEGKGTGLGLSISYGIIKEMNGTFEVQSKPGVGTTMMIRLPLEKRQPGLIHAEE